LIGAHDDKMIRCPRIGGDVSFKLCRSENSMLPCRWIVDCWKARMDIGSFLDEHFSSEDLKRIFGPPKPKLESLLEILERASKRE
jgi:hypothetical protein